MWTVGFGFLAFIATIAAFATLPMTFQPVINTDFSQVKIETVPGSTLEQTTAITRKVADMLAADTDVVEAAGGAMAAREPSVNEKANEHDSSATPLRMAAKPPSR